MNDLEFIKNELIKLNNKVDNGFMFINSKFEHLESRIDNIEDSLKSNNIRFINIEKELKINQSFYQKNKEIINNLFSGSLLALSNYFYNQKIKDQ